MRNAFLSLILAASLPAVAAEHADLPQSSCVANAGEEFVRGGQFKDLILRVPIIDGLESEGIWGCDKVLPRDKDNGVDYNQWCYWGGNPVKDGNYHTAVCRWPERTGHMGWFESEVAHCVSETPFGPYVITQTIVKRGHNPEVMKMPGGTCALHIMNADVYTSDRMPGPWTRIGRMTSNPRGLRPTGRLGSNLTSEFRPDGSILLMKKNGDIAVSNQGILGPYNLVSIDNYTRNSGYAEDPVVWRSRHQYHCIYNHAQDRKSGYMRSLDGIHWKNEEGLPYDVSSTYYTDGTKNEWYKFERPKMLQDEIGRATHLSLALLDTAKSSLSLIEEIAPTWEVNAKNIYGCRGIMSGARTAGRENYHTHFGKWPGHCWTAVRTWLIYPLYEYYLVTGDKEFLKKHALPLMEKAVLFYEDFLTEYDEDVNDLFVPSYSSEPLSGQQINAVQNIATGKQSIRILIEAYEDLGIEPDRVPHLKGMLEKFPPYLVNDEGVFS